MARIIFCIAAILLMTGCGKDEGLDVPENGILIEVEAPLTNGWNTEEDTGTRSCEADTIRQDGEDGIDMEISTRPDSAEETKWEATTRWNNLDDNITFRVVAYKATGAAGISTSNYAGYGDYKLSGTTVQTTRSLTLAVGTYTFICYSYGSAAAMTAFTAGSTSISATNGQNFMTCVKPNITINNPGSRYTLSNIVFKHHCVRYRIQAIAQAGRMGNITACSGSVTLPNDKATYNFTNGTFSVHAGTGSASISWSSPNAMNVYSNYLYMLPLSSKTLEIKISLTIGGKAYANKSITLSGITLNPNGIYHSDISFTTADGYIIGGNMWANGNLVYTSGTYKNYSNTMSCSKANNASDYFTFNNPYPNNADVYTSWSDSRDPCRKVSPANTWRTPTMQDCIDLINTGAVKKSDCTVYGEVLSLPYSSFMRFSSGHPHESYYDEVGYYLCTTYLKCLLNEVIGDNTPYETLAYPIRCIRN